jgi:uncharacterized RDD family membrane protein YckC
MVAQPEPMVTGDAVVLDIQIAQVPVRAVSAFIDITVVFIAYVVGLVLWAATLTNLDTALSGAVLIIFTVLTLVGYPLIFETTTRGRSLGKMAMGLRVVSDDGGPERFRQALFRALAGFIEIWMLVGGPAVICSLLSPKGKRIGDVFAGTMVISERGPRLPAPPVMPPSMAWWASSLQLSGLSAESAERARQFLSRATQLDVRVRDQMAFRIYAEVTAQISPPPPPGAPPQLVLAAVLAERHRRELSRLQPMTVAPAAPPTNVPSQYARTAQHQPGYGQPVHPMPPAPVMQPPPPQPGGFVQPD